MKSLFLCLLLVCGAIVCASPVLAASGCPASPANGSYWTVDEFTDASAAVLHEQVCCCIDNVIGDWEEQWHSEVYGGCDCPDIQPGWTCSQIQYIMTRSITPTSDSTRIMPSPPPGGWGANTISTHSVWVYCACTDENGDPVPVQPGCIILRSKYVPIRWTNCDDCPY